MVSDTERAIDATRFLLKAVRTARTYPPGNQICQRALAELLPHLKPALPLELGVTPQEESQRRGCFGRSSQRGS